MQDIKDLIGNPNSFAKSLVDKHKYISKEYQDFGYRIALKLGDLKHKALYIKLAKEKPRVVLEQALSFAVDYPNAKNRGKLFMWKIKDLGLKE